MARNRNTQRGYFGKKKLPAIIGNENTTSLYGKRKKKTDKPIKIPTLPTDCVYQYPYTDKYGLKSIRCAKVKGMSCKAKCGMFLSIDEVSTMPSCKRPRDLQRLSNISKTTEKRE